MSLMTTFTLGDTLLEVRSVDVKDPVSMTLRDLASRRDLSPGIFLDILETLATGAIWRGVMGENDFLIIRAIERRWP